MLIRIELNLDYENKVLGSSFVNEKKNESLDLIKHDKTSSIGKIGHDFRTNTML